MNIWNKEIVASLVICALVMTSVTIRAETTVPESMVGTGDGVTANYYYGTTWDPAQLAFSRIDPEISYTYNYWPIYNGVSVFGDPRLGLPTYIL